MDQFEPREMPCMRCGRPARLRFAGPCEGCVEELAARFPGVARHVETDAYVPKVNVTPNAVALKDD